MRNILNGMAALLGMVGASSMAEAETTLRMMKSLDAPHYDAQRTTWTPTADIVNLMLPGAMLCDGLENEVRRLRE